MSFALGHVHVRHLRLPLLSGRLRLTDCASLIIRITSQIHFWAARVLSFVDRLQLA